MKRDGLIRILFVVGGLYDGLLGLAFLAAPAALFSWAGVEPPNHFGYVQFPAMLLIVFALMFFAVAAKPRENRNLIPYGILLKVSYCGVVFWYWFSSGIPDMWKPFALADATFGVLFLWAWVGLTPERT